MDNDKRIAYGVMILGTLLAAASSVVPHYNAGYRLAFGLFLWGVLPYYAYLLLSGVAVGLRLVLPGGLMLVVDVIAKGYQAFHLESTVVGEAVALYLPIVLLIALTAGYIVGAKYDRQEVGG